MPRRMTAVLLIAMISISTLTACGKRGAPYRPSEVPAQTALN